MAVKRKHERYQIPCRQRPRGSFLADSSKLTRTTHPRREASRAQVVCGQFGLDQGAAGDGCGLKPFLAIRFVMLPYARLAALHSSSHSSNSVSGLICLSTSCTRYTTPSFSSKQIKKKSMLIAPQFGNIFYARATFN